MWKPDLATIKSWPSDERLRRYFIWLSAQRPLPSIPEGKAHPVVAEMADMLREVHQMSTKTIERFQGGLFDNFREMTLYDDQLDDPWIQAQNERANANAAVIREMLSFSGEITDQLIRDYQDRLSQTGYFAPTA